MSAPLVIFQALCEVGNALEWYRDSYPPGSDRWVAMTEILGWLDAAVDTLVHSGGLDDDDERADA